MKAVITIAIYDKPTAHIAYSGEGYDTLCGIDGSDPGIGHEITSNETALVDCDACKRIAEEGRKWRASDFA